jgi:putative transposase
MDMKDVTALAGKQRVFRARQKICTAGFISHITQRAAGGEPLFLEDSDYLLMLGLLKETAEKFDLSFYALCLMQNHVHLLLKPSKDNLSEAMHSIFFRYAKRFNQRYERRGHKFGGPYRQAVCLDNSYLLAASVYIHLNPVRAGLVNKAIDFRWSSCGLYCNLNAPASFVDPALVLGLLDQDQEQARKHYATIVHEAGKEHLDNALEQEGAIEKFLLRLSSLFPKIFKKLTDKKQTAKDGGKQILELPELDELLQSVLSSRSRSPETLKARRYLVEQLLARGYKKAEIARKLNVSRKTIFNILNKHD